MTISFHGHVLSVYDNKTKNQYYVKKYRKTYTHENNYICYGLFYPSRLRYAIDQMFSGYDIIACGAIDMPIMHVLHAGTSLEEMLVKYDLEKNTYAQQ